MKSFRQEGEKRKEKRKKRKRKRKEKENVQLKRSLSRFLITLCSDNAVSINHSIRYLSVKLKIMSNVLTYMQANAFNDLCMFRVLALVVQISDKSDRSLGKCTYPIMYHRLRICSLRGTVNFCMQKVPIDWQDWFICS